MQEEIQNISPIKQIILQYEDNLAKFLAIYKKININWLITGVRSMLKSEEIDMTMNKGVGR